MRKQTKVLLAGASVLALGAGTAGVAVGTGDDGPGTPITGGAFDKAKAAALAETGGGQVTGTEARDEEGYYEVEVVREDGSSVDVHLNRDFSVIDASDDGSGDEEEAGG